MVKNTKHKRKAYCNKFNKDFKNGPHEKRSLKKKVHNLRGLKHSPVVLFQNFCSGLLWCTYSSLNCCANSYDFWDICIKYCLKGYLYQTLQLVGTHVFNSDFLVWSLSQLHWCPISNSLSWTQPSTQSTYAHSQGTYKLSPILVIHFILYTEGYEIILKFKWL